MPPLFSSLAAALLSPERRPKTSDPNDIFGVSVGEVDKSSAEASSARIDAQHRAAAGDAAGFASNESTAQSSKKQQHPAVAMAVAYSLFLVGRGNADVSDPRPKHGTRFRRRPHQRRSPSQPTLSRAKERLPVRLNLRGKKAVEVVELNEEQVLASDESAPPGDEVEMPETYDWHVDLAHASDLRAAKRDIAIVTTAAMPWMTGTSINPALRAVYLAKDGHRVTLVVPWLPSIDQQRMLFSKGSPVFETEEEHRKYIQAWGARQVEGVSFEVLFYEGVYVPDFGSILPTGTVTDVFAPSSVVKDICILEEPEHLTWHHSGKVWTELFNIVVGIIHTNYIEYARKFGFFGPQKALALLFLNVWVCRGYCHRIIKLSDAVQEFPNSVTSNVHGVRDKFVDIGRQRSGPFPRGAYFMGKVLWAKGYRDLIDNMVEHHRATGEALPIDFFGAGPNVADVQAEIESEPGLSNVTFDARVADHTGTYLQGYKVFVNASRSDVVCTATAEALAMGKLVVCLEHPSNDFFASFPNCTTYKTPAEFGAAVTDALGREPLPLSEHDAYRLTWEAATERLYDAMRLPLSKRKPSKVGHALGNVHSTLSKIYPHPGKGAKRAMSRELLQASASKG